MSAAQTGDGDIYRSSQTEKPTMISDENPARVTISFLEIGKVKGKLVLLPGTLKALMEVGGKKFRVGAEKVVSKEDGAEIEDVEITRDGDHLVLVGNGGRTQKPGQNNGGLLVSSSSI